jgi:hypothetical protein
VVLGSSQKSSTDVQLEQFAVAWGMATAEVPAVRALTVRIVSAESEVRHVFE